MKKIGVLTLPTLTNYGGILQAYALVYTLRKLGYDAWLINRRWNSENNGFVHKVKKFVYHQFVIRKFDKFVEKYIKPRTEEIASRAEMNAIRCEGFNGYVVGSDQVWRVKNVRGADYNFFLDFTKNDVVKRISYAASFGVDYWDDNKDSQQSIAEVKPLLQKFDAVSVREDSGVKICKECFDVDAVQVLDPTLLLSKDEYLSAFKLKHNKEKKYIAVYILDMTDDKKKIIQTVSEKLKLPVMYINEPKTKCSFLPQSLSEMVKPGVESWLQAINDASFVLTDSFHGTAFSIIFEKEFLVIGNKQRGLTRFTSLLRALNLDNHIIMNSENFDMEAINSNIDYQKVNLLKEKLQEFSNFFLKHNIS